MALLRRNFARSEFACKGNSCCGHSAPVDEALLDALQALRDYIGQAIHINSGFRCNVHNANVGGSPSSMHRLGKAADIVAELMHPAELADAAERIPILQRGGIGRYSTFVHVDTRGVKARWSGR